MKQKTKNRNPIVFRRWTRKPYAIFNSLHKEIKIGVLSLSCSLTLLNVQPAFAQVKTTDTSSISQKELAEIAITAERPTPFEPLMDIVAVISKQEIEQAGVQNAQDLLRYIQGVDLRARGSEGVQADISLRGGSFDQTIILLNGINFTDPQTGHFSFNLPLNLNSIERIEILQGPGAWVAGSIAFSGAVNIITKKSDSTNLVLDLSGGQHQYYQVGAWAALNKKKWWVSGAANISKSDGYRPNTDFDIKNFYIETAFDDDAIGNFDFQIGYQSKDYGANSFYSAQYPEQYEETKAFITSLKYTKQWQRWRAQASLYYRKHHDKFELFRYQAPDWYKGHNYHLTDVWGAYSQVGYAWLAGLTTIGFEYRNEHIFSSNMGEEMDNPQKDPFDSQGVFKYAKDRRYGNVFLQHLITKRKWNACLGIMQSGNNDYGYSTYWGGNFKYLLPHNLNISAWVQQSYRMPTFTDLYYNSPSQKGNVNLQPEQVIATEWSLQWTPKQWNVRLLPFYRYGFKIIDWVRQPYEEVWHSENQTDVQTLGVDISVGYQFKNLYLKQVKLSCIWQTQSKNANNYLSLYTTDYLRNQLKLSVSHKIWKSFSAAWLFSIQDRAGTYLDFSTKQETHYKPYLLCNLQVSWTKKYFTVFADISNLFNTNYLDIGNLPQPGIWAKLGVTVKL